jgi:hypothetical protein
MFGLIFGLVSQVMATPTRGLGRSTCSLLFSQGLHPPPPPDIGTNIILQQQQQLNHPHSNSPLVKVATSFFNSNRATVQQSPLQQPSDKGSNINFQQQQFSNPHSNSPLIKVATSFFNSKSSTIPTPTAL